jgi:sec-independent protein translocase protein TatA
MPNLGPAELFVIFIVALLVFGPNKLPEIGRQVGKAIREFRRVQHSLTDDFQDAFAEEPPRPSASATAAWRPAAGPGAASDPPPSGADGTAGNASGEAAAITHPDTPADGASPGTEPR